ncbi:MAG: RNA polymerase sigma-70 factor [Cyclobacteriaceae bacterium]
MRSYKTHNDLKLLELVRDWEDQRAFEELYQRYFDPVFRFVFKVMQDRETAEDLVQNIFMGFWKKPPLLSISELRPYLFGAARNQIAKEIRRNKWNKAQLDYLEDILGSNCTEEYLAAKETSSRIVLAIHRLPQKCRHVFELSRFNYLSNKEIAAKLGISVFTVENHIKKALIHLRQSLELLLFVFSSCISI